MCAPRPPKPRSLSPPTRPQATQTLEKLVSIVGGDNYESYINFMVRKIQMLLPGVAAAAARICRPTAPTHTALPPPPCRRTPTSPPWHPGSAPTTAPPGPASTAWTASEGGRGWFQGGRGERCVCPGLRPTACNFPFFFCPLFFLKVRPQQHLQDAPGRLQRRHGALSWPPAGGWKLGGGAADACPPRGEPLPAPAQPLTALALCLPPRPPALRAPATPSAPNC